MSFYRKCKDIALLLLPWDCPHLSLQKSKKVSLQSLPTDDSPPTHTHTQPSTKPYYMTLKWLLCFSPSVDVKDPSRSSTKVHLRDWSVVNVLIQRCPWSREMSCLMSLHAAYITEYRATGRNQQMEGHYLDLQAALIWSCICTSYGDTGQVETRLVSATRAFS